MKKLFILLMILVPALLYSQKYVAASNNEPFNEAEGVEVELAAASAQTPVYISVQVSYINQYCYVTVSASAAVASDVTVYMRSGGGLGHFSLTIPNGSTSTGQMYYVPGDDAVDVEEISPSCDAYHCYY